MPYISEVNKSRINMELWIFDDIVSMWEIIKR